MINNLPDKLKNDIIEYCRINDIDDINTFIIKLIRQSLTIEIYGRTPKIFKSELPIEIKGEIKEEVSKEENKFKSEYKIEVDLVKKQAPKEIKVRKNDDDIYGEGY